VGVPAEITDILDRWCWEAKMFLPRNYSMGESSGHWSLEAYNAVPSTKKEERSQGGFQ
jgi:hypothetical protein